MQRQRQVQRFLKLHFLYNALTHWALKRRHASLCPFEHAAGQNHIYKENGFNQVCAMWNARNCSLWGHLAKEELKPNDEEKQACDLMFPWQWRFLMLQQNAACRESTATIFRINLHWTLWQYIFSKHLWPSTKLDGVIIIIKKNPFEATSNFH